MEVPSAFRANAILNEKIKVIESIAPIKPDDVVLGQYIEGLVDGSAVPSYTEETWRFPSVMTPTFSALRLSVANWRWHGVPFYRVALALALAAPLIVPFLELVPESYNIHPSAASRGSTSIPTRSPWPASPFPPSPKPAAGPRTLPESEMWDFLEVRGPLHPLPVPAGVTERRHPAWG